MDPVTAICNVITSINTIVNTLLSKASSAEIDKMIDVHLNRISKFEAFLEKLIH